MSTFRRKTDPQVSVPSVPSATTPEAWQALLAELSELHARLQYLKLMLKLGVERF